MIEKTVKQILDQLSLGENLTILDAYCGTGLFSAFLAPHCKKLIGIETSPSACSDFVHNLDDFDNVELYEAAVEDLLPHLEEHIDVIILDPPRAGIDRRAMDGMMRLSAFRLVYISCDPATLARDAKRLAAGGYRLLNATPFDMFPQTYHIESISFWAKN